MDPIHREKIQTMLDQTKPEYQTCGGETRTVHQLRKETKTIDQVFEDMKWCSKFQLCFQLATMFVSLTVCYFFMLSVFVTSDSAWKCTPTINNQSDVKSFCTIHTNKTFAVGEKDFEARCALERNEWSFVTPEDFSALTEFDLICDRTYVSGEWDIPGCFSVRHDDNSVFQVWLVFCKINT